MNDKNFKYLVIDDSEMNCEGIIVRMMKYSEWENCGFELSCKNAIKNIEQNLPELIFLDWQIKGGDASPIIEHIESMKNYEPYIIVNTAHLGDRPEIAEEVHNKYSVDKLLCVGKPSYKKIFSNIEAYLNEAKKKPESYAEVIKTNNEVWLKDINGISFKKDINNLQGIIHIVESRVKQFLFCNEKEPLLVNFRWEECYKLLNQHSIDFFITNRREHIVIRKYIIKVNGDAIYIDGKEHFKIKVVKEKKKEFEIWFRKYRN